MSYLNKLKNAITKVRIYIEKDALIPMTGQFEIHEAEFSKVPSTTKPVDETNYYSGNKQAFSFNQLWTKENALIATFETINESVKVDYQKQFLTSGIFSSVQGKLSDFDYINIRLIASPNQAFLFEIDTMWSFRMDHHLVADASGVIEFSMAFGMHYFDRDIDAIKGFRILPIVNDSEAIGSFTIEVAEFSNTPLVNYDVTDEIELKDFRQIGDTFNIYLNKRVINQFMQEYTVHLFQTTHYIINSSTLTQWLNKQLTSNLK